jgi:hypothetical protein
MATKIDPKELQKLASERQKSRLLLNPQSTLGEAVLPPQRVPRILAAKLKLDWLMAELVKYRNDCGLVILKAPIKGMDRAHEKVWAPKEGSGSWAGDWGELKDYARTTLVLPDNHPSGSPVWEMLIGTVKTIFSSTGRYGFNLPKSNKNDGKKNGYVDHNFVFQFGQSHFICADVMANYFNGTPMPALSASTRVAQYAGCFGEIQINNVNMMYAKMDADLIHTNWPGAYARYQETIGLDGGLGHALYEVIRRYGEHSNIGREASAISKDYYLRCRGLIRKPAYPRTDFLKLQLKEMLKLVPEKLTKKEAADPDYNYSYTEDQI